MNWQRCVMIVMVVTIGLASCKKDSPVINPPQVDPSPMISVKLNAYMQKIEIDSAIATWTKGNQVIQKPMTIKKDSLVVSSEIFPTGNGVLTIQIFSNKKLGQYKSIWVMNQEFSLLHDRVYSFSGPAALMDVLWKPRVVLNDAIGHEAIVGLMPEDPYFKIKKVNNQVVKLVVDKAYWRLGGGVNNIAQKTWQCGAGCIQYTEDIINEDFFKSFPTMIGDKPWNHIEIYILYADNPIGTGWALNFNFNVQ